MKKTVKILSLVMALSMMLLALVSCSSFGTVKGRFEAAGYTMVENDEDVDNTLGDEDLNCKVYAFKPESGLHYAIILEFNSSDELNKKIDESETIKGLIKDIQNEDSDLIEGNCLLIPIDLNLLSTAPEKEMIDIFKGRK